MSSFEEEVTDIGRQSENDTTHAYVLYEFDSYVCYLCVRVSRWFDSVSSLKRPLTVTSKCNVHVLDQAETRLLCRSYISLC